MGDSTVSEMNGTALDVGAYGQDVYMLDLEGKPNKYNYDTQDWDNGEFTFTGGINIAVGPEGKLYVTKENGEIWFYEKVITQAQENEELQALGIDQVTSKELLKLINESFESFVEDEVKKESVLKSNYILDYYNFTKIFVDPLLKEEKDELADIVKQDSLCLKDLKSSFQNNCTKKFNTADQVENKYSCYSQINITRSPKYCTEMQASNSENYFYKFKNKYDCLSNPNAPYKVQLDDEAFMCLNKYFEY